MTLWLVLGVSAVGALGAVTRFVVDGLVKSLFPTPVFPWGTFVINVSGSFLLGVVTGLVLFQGAPTEVRVILGVGFCSSYTTFSTAVWESVVLARRGRRVLALANAFGTIAATTAAASIGLWLATVI